jgi:beta-phosphoglucomutase-like phosphatase (HAD superfamily)
MSLSKPQFDGIGDALIDGLPLDFSGKGDFIALERTTDGLFRIGANGVRQIVSPKDGKVEFIVFADHTLAYVKSAMGYPAYYPLHPVRIERPVKAVLMDLDGTSVHSENFWIWIIQLTIADLLGDKHFELIEADFAHVSGHSVSEHLQYCIKKYCPQKTVEEARRYYYAHTRREMQEIIEGRGRADAFTPAPGLKAFLLELKSHGIKIGLVTSGLYEKAWPEIVSAFRQLKMGAPTDFYDAIITAGCQPTRGAAGTLGELEAKPHPWLYAEAARVGLGIPFAERHSVIGLEDSGAGVVSIRLAGYAAIGMAGGNIEQSGTQFLTSHYCDNFKAVWAVIDGK